MRSKKLKVAGIITIVFAMFFIYACGDDAADVHELVGTWELTTLTTYYGSVSNPDSTEIMQPPNFTMTMVFKDDNTLSVTWLAYGFSDSDTGTWSTSGNNLTTEWSDGEIETVEYSVSGNALTVTDNNVSGETSITELTRQ